jgi:predicted membrane channel-forming protein YqfA (hemolysin III family)
VFPALVLIVLGAIGALAVFGVVTTVRDRPPGRPLRVATGVVIALLVLQAAIAAVRVFSGVTLPETSTFLIYLVVSICVLPIAVQYANAEPTRWGGTVIAVAAIATAVAVLRLQGLWAAGGV